MIISGEGNIIKVTLGEEIRDISKKSNTFHFTLGSEFY